MSAQDPDRGDPSVVQAHVVDRKQTNPRNKHCAFQSIGKKKESAGKCQNLQRLLLSINCDSLPQSLGLLLFLSCSEEEDSIL